jgi:hypothetical protein
LQFGSGLQGLNHRGGGGGIMKFGTQNDSLLMKSLHKFFNKLNIPWVKLIWEYYYSNGKFPRTKKIGYFYWKNVTKLINQYKGIAKVQAHA